MSAEVKWEKPRMTKLREIRESVTKLVEAALKADMQKIERLRSTLELKARLKK